MRPIKTCFNNQIANICNRVLELESLNAKVNQFLPEELRAHCQVGSYHCDALILTTTDSAWATQLRFLKSDLRDKLRKEAGLFRLRSVDIKIIETSSDINVKTKKNNAILSKKGQESIKLIRMYLNQAK